MKAEILKIAGVKSEKEFYKRYPTEEAFMKAHSKEFKKAKLGVAMAQDGWVQRAANAEFECKGHPRSNLRSEFSDGRTKAERKEDAAWDKEVARQEAIEKKEIAAQKAQEWAEYINTGLDPYGEKYGRKDKTFSDSYNKFIAANPNFAEEQSNLGLSPQQRYAMIYKVASRSASPDAQINNRIRQALKLNPKDKFTDAQMLEFVNKVGGWDKYVDWWKSGYPAVQKYGGETKKLNQLTNFTNDVDDLIPMAQMGNAIGSYTGGDVVPNAQPIMLNDLYAQNISQLTGLSEQEARKKADLFQQPEAPKIDWKATMTDFSKAFDNKENKAKKGKKVPKYQVAPAPIPLSPKIPNLSQFASTVTGTPNITSGAPTGSVDRIGGFMGKIGGIGTVANIAGDILGGIQGLAQEKQMLTNVTATKNISDVVRRASGTRPEQMQRQYLRPEDALVQPNQLSPSYGVGTNFLSRNGSVLRAEDGMQIGGNLGEIQNTYAPGTLYDDLGYEPLNDSDDVKQYYHGGIHRAQNGNWLTQNSGAIEGVGNLAANAFGANNAGGQLGKGIGTAIGTAIPVPGLGKALGAVGGLVGGLFDKKAKKIEAAQKAIQKNVQATSLQQGIQAMGAQNAGFVRNGGDIPRYQNGSTGCPPGYAWDGELEKCAPLPSDAPTGTGGGSMPTLGGMPVDQNGKPISLGFNVGQDKTFNISGGYRGDIANHRLGNSAYNLAFDFPRIFGKDKGLTVTGDYGRGNLKLGVNTKFPLLGGTLGVKGGYSQNLTSPKATGADSFMTVQPSSNRGNIGAGLEWNKKIGKTNLKISGSYGRPGMEEGGWVSHDWQPQVITTFGEHSMEDLLRPDPMMDTLRTGGHITQNNMFPVDKYALGGELKTTWGGYAEPISYNPYMPGTGETVMFRGKSHDESDGNGHTGIGVKYGSGEHDSYTDYAEYGTENADADVEVERGEPATEMIDGQTGEKNMVVFGNLKIPNMFLGEIGDSSAKGKKFKNYVADLGKVEAKQNKIIEKATNKIDELEVFTPFDKLKMDALQAMTLGANMKLKDIAVKKSNAAAVQNAINDTAAEYMLDADHLAKGKIKQDKEAMKQAKWGAKMETAQGGDVVYMGGWKSPLTTIKYNEPEPKFMKATPRYRGKLTEPWDPKGETHRKFYTQAFDKFKKQMKEGKEPFVPYRLNSNVASVYEKALEDFNEQRGSDIRLQEPTSFKKEEAKKSGEKPVTTTGDGGNGGGNSGGGSGSKKSKTVTTKGKTNMTVTSPFTKRVTDVKTVDIPLPVPKIPTTIDPSKLLKLPSKEETTTKQDKKKTDWMNIANALLPYVRPSDQEDFDYAQVYPELAAMAMNQLEPVKAQLYRPDLGTPMDISLQDQLNANQADFNALQRQVGYNPAALSALAAQKYAANQSVLGEQFRLNQAEKQRVYEGNRALLNQAQLQNLGILDQQFVRQEEAKSKTKAQGLEAIKSIADKIAKNKLENRTLGIYENLYNYRYDKSGRAINMNPLYQFDVTTDPAKASRDAAPEGYEYETILKKKKKTADESRNGSIVKAIKNL